MRKTVHSKLIACYILIGIIGFLFATAGGSHFVESYLEGEVGHRLYDGATRFASDEIAKTQITEADKEGLQKLVDILASGEEAGVLLFDENAHVLVQSSNIASRMAVSDAKSIEMDFADADKAAINDNISPFELDSELWESAEYRISNFYGYFDSPQLNVVAPIKDSEKILGYVTYHYDMQQLYQKRSGLLGILQMIFFGVYALCGLLLLFYQKWVHIPMKQIIKGASEYANGDLTYRIPVKSEDELGYLSNTLNYMADKINQNGEYQRTFIANVSHDFRSPLTSIKGYVQAMTDGTIPPELHEKYLNIILFEVERLTDLTTDLLTLNEFDTKELLLDKTTFDIQEVIKNTALSFEGVCTPKHISIQLLLLPDAVFVCADKRKIQQVLYNLIDNAIKFSENESSVFVEVSGKNDKIFVSVKDQGIGIPKKELNKIWERFYKSDLSRGKDKKGTGLGLAIVKEVIQAHDEHINVISTEGVGTEFIFSLSKASQD